MKLFLSIVIILICFNSYSQVKFEDISLNEALQKASASGKIVFAQFETETCDECNDVANKAFKDTALGKVIAQKCIPIKIDVLSKERQEFISRFPSVATMGTYFIIGSGELLHRYARTTTLPGAYVNEINTAYNKWQEGMVTLQELEDEWNNKADDFFTMEKYLDKRLSLNLPTDSLLDIYVTRLPPDSLSSKRVLIFIASHAPIIGSKADKGLRKNSTAFNMAWFTLPLQQRININGRIIGKSLQKAINKKDESFLNSIASFQAQTYDNRNSEAAQKYNDNLYLTYYRSIKDSAKYLQLVVPFFDKYLMSHPVSSILAQDSVQRILLLKNTKGDTVKNANGFTIKKVLQSYAPKVQFYSRELNDGAWTIYTYTSNNDLLNKALEWAKRANESYPTSASMDTYARLLYKTGNPKKAIEWETKAIEQQKERKYGYKRFEEVLEKMNKGETAID